MFTEGLQSSKIVSSKSFDSEEVMKLAFSYLTCLLGILETIKQKLRS